MTDPARPDVLDPNRPIPGPDPGACPDCGVWMKAGMEHRCAARPDALDEKAVEPKSVRDFKDMQRHAEAYRAALVKLERTVAAYRARADLVPRAEHEALFEQSRTTIENAERRMYEAMAERDQAVRERDEAREQLQGGSYAHRRALDQQQRAERAEASLAACREALERIAYGLEGEMGRFDTPRDDTWWGRIALEALARITEEDAERRP